MCVCKHTVYDCIYGDSPATHTVHTPCIYDPGQAYAHLLGFGHYHSFSSCLISRVDQNRIYVHRVFMILANSYKGFGHYHSFSSCLISRVGQNRIYVHRVYMILANLYEGFGYPSLLSTCLPINPSPHWGCLPCMATFNIQHSSYFSFSECLPKHSRSPEVYARSSSFFAPTQSQPFSIPNNLPLSECLPRHSHSPY